ncbi:MAG: phosphate acyltransferase PlsX [Clostridia bacterium]|nr:phosphate acyltransferase PlsX [Clostridia bacterium]
MRVIVDAMGGDRAPLEVLRGTAEASRRCNAELILVGDRNRLLRIAQENNLDLTPFEIVHTPSVITMEDDPIAVLRGKKDSSMIVGLNLLAQGKGDAFVSAGNTGALFTAATFIVKRVRGVGRAAIGTVLPGTKSCLLLDAGANITVSEEYLEQFAVMGSAYMQEVYGVAAPAVGLLNNGTEDSKGTPLQVQTNRRLCACDAIRYVGNVEGSTVLFGACDVLVADGFTGNVFLKTVEGTAKLLMGELKDAMLKNALTKLAALPLKKSMGQLKRRLDPGEHGGSPILGISKPIIKAHGSSDARAICNAVLAAVRYAQSDVIGRIGQAADRFHAIRKAESEEISDG